MSSRRGATPPAPPPRDPAGINSIVQRHTDEDMSSDSSSPPRSAPHQKRRSSYENVDGAGFYPNKPPQPLRRSRESLLQRSTPSPAPRHDPWADALSDDAAGMEPSVRRRPPSSCGRAPRSHRGSMPPVECMSSGWGHRSPCTPCCAASPVPFHWCGPPQGWSHFPGYQDFSPFTTTPSPTLYPRSVECLAHVFPVKGYLLLERGIALWGGGNASQKAFQRPLFTLGPHLL
ncbi:uncharacterized protein CEXT_654521 [Caerostris extrusa]|uniref:Uncharacterized protein n=1 Tax=Caerostris extrusa TaxID=172846 RepID=A0AAV4PGX1_CAEEX|nr:uncharacterized protein CEXT_654521 [Caerostris extrusa]